MSFTAFCEHSNQPPLLATNMEGVKIGMICWDMTNHLKVGKVFFWGGFLGTKRNRPGGDWNFLGGG